MLRISAAWESSAAGCTPTPEGGGGILPAPVDLTINMLGTVCIVAHSPLVHPCPQPSSIFPRRSTRC